jgi:hypothetical protein
MRALVLLREDLHELLQRVDIDWLLKGFSQLGSVNILN